MTQPNRDNFRQPNHPLKLRTTKHLGVIKIETDTNPDQIVQMLRSAVRDGRR